MQGSRFVALLALVAALLVPVASRADQTWVVVSDIHLNPYFAQTRPSLPGSDSNLALLASSLAAMKRVAPNPSVVLIPGDFLAHFFPRLVSAHDAGTAPSGAGLATMKTIAERFNATYPNAQFAIVMGNNDDPCGDYRSPIGGDYIRALAKIWEPLVNRGGAAPDFVEEFSHGGYYKASLPVRGLRLIALNSVYFSKEYLGDCKGRQPDAAPHEIAWLGETLAATPAGTRNVLAMHIPPGYDAFVTETARGVIAWPYFAPDSDAAFLETLARNTARIAFGIAGHEHRFDFRLVAGKPDVPLLVFGALSPIYGNNPTFATLAITPQGEVRDISFDTFDESSGNWLLPRSFKNAWMAQSPIVGADALAAIHQGLEEKPAMRPGWDAQSIAWPAPNAQARYLWGAGWLIPWCAQTELDTTYATCAKTGDPASWLRAFLALAPLVLVVAVLAAILIRRRARS